jgi:hypothetical protein
VTGWQIGLLGLFLLGVGLFAGLALGGLRREVTESPEHLRDLVAHKHRELENAVEVNRRLLAQRDEARHRLAEAETREIYLLERLDLAEGAGR